MNPSRFVPHPLARGGSLQTIIAYAWQAKIPLVESRRLELVLSNGDKVTFYIEEPQGKSGDSDSLTTPTVVLIHGLGGSAQAPYNLRLAYKLTKLGYRVVRVNHRGAGVEGPQLSRGIYHAGASEDLYEFLTAVQKLHPQSSLYAIGFSLSGNVLLKLMGMEPQSTSRLLSGAISVCAPVDLEACSLSLDAWRNLHFDKFYLYNVLKNARERTKYHSDISLPRFTKTRSLRLFDEHYTAKQVGFLNRSDYYSKSSSRDLIQNISQVPTFLLAAKDDPVVPPKELLGCRLGKSVRLQMEESGGHMGFLSANKTPWQDLRWMDWALLDWLSKETGKNSIAE